MNVSACRIVQEALTNVLKHAGPARPQQLSQTALFLNQLRFAGCGVGVSLITILGFPLLEWLPDAEDPDAALSSRNNLAMSYLAAGRVAEAIPLYERTLADCERMLGADDPNTIRSRNNLAMSYRAAGRTAEAIPLLERTLADCERVLGADHSDTVTSRSNLAMSYRAAGRTAEAIALLERTSKPKKRRRT